MKFPQLPFRKKVETMSRQDEKVFAEASELAHLRLEQCIADLRILPAALDDVPDTWEPRSLPRLQKMS